MEPSGSEMAPAGFFSVRTPLKPLATLLGWSHGLRAAAALDSTDAALSSALEEDEARLVASLRDLVGEADLREALHVASSDLEDGLVHWLAHRPVSRPDRIVDSLVRYVARACSRATPFGLFAGMSVGERSLRTQLLLDGGDAYRRRARLDVQYLTGIAQALEQRSDVRAALSYRPNPSLLRGAARLAYAEAETNPDTGARTYRLAEVRPSPALDAVLSRGSAGAKRDELIAALLGSDETLSAEDASVFVDEIIDSQLLLSDLTPPVCGGEPLLALLARLRACGGAQDAVSALDAVHADLERLDGEPLGVAAERYRAIAEKLASLPALTRPPRLFHVDLHKPARALTLGPRALAPLADALRDVCRMTLHRENPELRRFKDAFAERYDDQLELAMVPLSERSGVPLLEALDDEIGVGFGSSETGDVSPLLDSLELPDSPFPPDVPFGRAQECLVRGLVRCLHQGTSEWRLDAADIAQLTAGPGPRFPDAVSVTATLIGESAAAVDAGKLKWVVRSVQGPSGATRLTRFCHADSGLLERVKAQLALEEAQRPDAIFAEIVHLPFGPDANVVSRPPLRAHEIDCLGWSDAQGEHRLPLADLRLTLVDDRLVLFSASRGREVIPRLTSSHNADRSPLPVYRFLVALQQERETRELGWSWGPLEGAPFLPRVTLGNVVLSEARWTLTRDELHALREAEGPAWFREAQRLRQRHRLPRWVGIVDGDNVLPVDLENVLLVRQLAKAGGQQERLTLVELFLDEDRLVTGPSNEAFAHELVIPFLRTAPAAAESAPAPARAPSRRNLPRVERVLPPGSSWLFAKLYCGPAEVDALLTEAVGPLAHELVARGAATRWFFVRYADPRWHLRVRFAGAPARLTSEVLPALHECVADWLRDRRVYRLQLDTYEREVERYGGAAAIELAEELFEADSEAVLAILEETDPAALPDVRWRLVLRGAHELLVDLGLDLRSREAILDAARRRFGAEHNVGTAFEQQLSRRYRQERDALEGLLQAREGDDEPWDPGLAQLRRRSSRIQAVAAGLRALAREGRLLGSIEGLAPSFVHMACNRLLRSNQRAHELVIYDFLLRLYRSQLARERAPRKLTGG